MRFPTSVSFILLIALMGCNVSPDASIEEKEKIQQITLDWINALNNGDAERVASFYDEDARYATNNGLLLKGKQQISEAFDQWLQTPQKVVSDSSFVAFNTEGDLAYSLNYYAHHIYPPKADSFVNKGYSLTVYERQEDGSWKIDALTINKHPNAQKPVAKQMNKPDADLIITNGRIITGTGEVLENGSVLIKENKILSIEKEVGSAGGSKVIDAKGKTVLPGLIDAHVHLLVEEMTAHPRSSEELEIFIKNGIPERLQAYLKTGITTVISTGDYWPAIKGVRDSIRSGSLSGPRIYTSGPVFTAPGGHPAVTVCGNFNEEDNNPWCREHMSVEVETKTEARKAVDSLARQGVDLIKMVYDDTSPPDVEHLKAEAMREIITAAHEQGLRAYAHIFEAEDAVTAVEAGLDGLVHTPFRTSQPNQRDKLVEMIQTQNITTTTTSVVIDALRLRFANEGNEELSQWFKNNLSDQQQIIAQLSKESDSLITLGTDAPQLTPGRAYHREIELAADAGLIPDQIIKAATRNAGIHLGRGNDLGTLEPGKLADLIMVDGNPLKDLSVLQDIAMVVKGGKIVVENGEIK